MPRSLPASLANLARRTLLYVLVLGVAVVVLLPIYFLVALSFMSDYEVYQEKPLPLVPAFVHEFSLQRTAGGFQLSRVRDRGREAVPLMRSASAEALCTHIQRTANAHVAPEELQRMMAKLAPGEQVRFTRRKSLFANYATFFRVAGDRTAASVWRSIATALATIAISLTIGSLAGYAFARYAFCGRHWLKVSVLFVRMYPGVAIALPMAVFLGHMGLYDRPLGLSLVYAVGQVGLSIWITASIFLSIPPELEEAAQVFGTSRAGAFWHVTLPLALPGLAACAMYAFIMAWNETLQAIVLTQSNPTFPVVVYQALVGEAKDMVNFAAAGGVAMALPAVLFTLLIRKYILRMWGAVGL